MDRSDYNYIVSMLALVLSYTSEGLAATLWAIFAFVALAFSIYLSVMQWRFRRLRKKERELRAKNGIRQVNFSVDTDASDEQIKQLVDAVQLDIDEWGESIKKPKATAKPKKASK